MRDREFWSEEETKTYLGTLRGYRFWRFNVPLRPLTFPTLNPVIPYMPPLRSAVFATPWLSGENRAVCAPVADVVHPGTIGLEHLAPMPGCYCGIYAWYSPVEAIRNYDNSYFGITDGWNDLFMGVIKASGFIIPATQGFRAEIASIEALVLRTDITPANEEKIRTYYFNTDILKTHKEMMERYPPSDVSSLVRTATKKNGDDLATHS